MQILPTNKFSKENDYHAESPTESSAKSNEPCQYIWGRSRSTKAINEELNNLLGNDGVSNEDEAVSLAQFCIELKTAYNLGYSNYKKCDIEEVSRMVEKARREYCKEQKRFDVGL